MAREVCLRLPACGRPGMSPEGRSAYLFVSTLAAPRVTDYEVHGCDAGPVVRTVFGDVPALRP